MISNWVRRHQLLTFFSISYGIMFASVFAHLYLLPQLSYHGAWALFAFSPTYSALIVSWLVGGRDEVKRLLSGFTRWRVGLPWYLAAVFLVIVPLIVALIYRALGNSAPGLKPGMTALVLSGLFIYTLFSGPASEEAGWRGFALPRLQAKYSAFVSSLILGVIWTGWHIPLYFIPGSSQQGIPFPVYLALVVTLTVYMTWLYNNTNGSLLITTLAHFSFNLTGGFIAGTLGLLPPMVLYMSVSPGLVLAVIAVVWRSGIRNLSRKPADQLPFQRRQYGA